MEDSTDCDLVLLSSLCFNKKVLQGFLQYSFTVTLFLLQEFKAYKYIARSREAEGLPHLFRCTRKRLSAVSGDLNGWPDESQERAIRMIPINQQRHRASRVSYV